MCRGIAKLLPIGRPPLAVALLAATSLALSSAARAPTAHAAVTIGQTGPVLDCGQEDHDYVQPTVTSGQSYVVPSTVPNWTLTSWSTDGNAAGPLTMKVFRPLGGGQYLVVGHDGPRSIAPGILNTFATSLAVKAADVLGLSVPPNGACIAFSVPGESFLDHSPSLADGASGTFTPRINSRLDVSAVATPANELRIAAVSRSRRKGTATVTVEVSNPGTITVTGAGLADRDAAASSPGEVDLRLTTTGRKRRKLARVHRVTVQPSIKFTPTGGDPRTESLSLKLRRKR